jgi:hypothetical protein
MAGKVRETEHLEDLRVDGKRSCPATAMQVTRGIAPSHSDLGTRWGERQRHVPTARTPALLIGY